MDTTNGTLLNGVVLRGLVSLKQGDMLKLGSSVQLQFVNYNVDTSILLGNQDTSFPPIDLSSHTRETNPSLLKTPNKRRKTSNLGTGLEPGALENHIYVAYAREDWESFIAALTVSLQDAGLQVWSTSI